jgi:hypothetical protein
LPAGALFADTSLAPTSKRAKPVVADPDFDAFVLESGDHLAG